MTYIRSVRVFLAFVVAAAFVAGAVALYSGTAERECARFSDRPSTAGGIYSLRRGGSCVEYQRRTPTWAIGGAAFLAIAGVGAGLGLGLGRRASGGS
jgi:hypothetical protein